MTADYKRSAWMRAASCQVRQFNCTGVRNETTADAEQTKRPTVRSRCSPFIVFSTWTGLHLGQDCTLRTNGHSPSGDIDVLVLGPWNNHDWSSHLSGMIDQEWSMTWNYDKLVDATSTCSISWHKQVSLLSSIGSNAIGAKTEINLEIKH